MVLPVGIAPTTRRFEAGRSDLLSYGSLLKWCAGAVLPRLPPQCRCGDLLVFYRRMMPRDEDGDERWHSAKNSFKAIGLPLDYGQSSIFYGKTAYLC